MKNYLGSLGTVLLTGALVLGMGAGVGAQQAPPASQQPMEIPAQYPPQPQGGPQPQGRRSRRRRTIRARRASASFTAMFRRSTMDRLTGPRRRSIRPCEWRPYFHRPKRARGNSAGSRQHTAHVGSIHRQCREPVAHADANSDRARPGELRSLQKQRSERRNRNAQCGHSPGRWAKAATASWSTPTAKRLWTCARAPRKFPRRKAAPRAARPAHHHSRQRGQRAVSSFRRAGQRRLGQVEQRPRPHDRRRAKLAPHQSLLHRHAKIWTPTANGRMSPTTAACGFHPTARAGRRTATAAGCMSLTTAGPGFPMSLGAGRRITTAAGSFMAGTGAGGRDRSMRGYHPLWAPAYVSFFGFGGGGWGVGWIRFRRRLRKRGLAAVRTGRSLLPVVRPRDQPRERGQHQQHS